VFAHTTIVFLRYQLLAVAARDATDPRTIGTLFWEMCDEVADLRFVEAWYILIEGLRKAFLVELRLSDTPDRPPVKRILRPGSRVITPQTRDFRLRKLSYKDHTPIMSCLTRNCQLRLG